MNSPLVVRPDRYRQFDGDRDGRPFFLVTCGRLTDAFALETTGRPAVVTALGDDLAATLSTIPPDADVLVAAPGSFLGSPDATEIGDRRLAVVPCGSTPVSLEQLRYCLLVLERNDPAGQAARAAAFFTEVADSDRLSLVDEARGTTCVFEPHAGDYTWNQQAGALGPGEQQIAPAGELSVLPADIAGFDPEGSLALSGELTLRGWPIVHAGYDPRLEAEQAALFERLLPLQRAAVILTVGDGIIRGCRPVTPDAEPAAAALAELFAADPGYRIVWELGVGINTDMDIVPGNCGPNEVHGGRHGVVHLGLGLTPATRFALTFLCPDTVLAGERGRSIAGRPAAGEAAPARRPRINRTRAASCGCGQP